MSKDIFYTTKFKYNRDFSRGDTCSIAGVFSGIELGTWFSYQIGWLTSVEQSYPLTLDFSDVFSVTTRTVLGLAIAGLTEFAAKKIFLSFLCRLFNEDKRPLMDSKSSVENKTRNFVDLTSKFLTYCLLGFNVIVVAPLAFKYFNIQRDAFFSEL